MNMAHTRVRTWLVAVLAAALLGSPASGAQPQDIALPKRPASAQADLVQALENRKSVRDYRRERLAVQDLSAVLWAANGVNRDYGRRTAPSAFGNEYIELYVVGDEGAWRYDASAHRLKAAGPAGLPPCPGFLSLESATGDARSGASILISRQTVASLLDSYATDLSADGWILNTSLQQGREHHLLFRQGERFLRLQIGPSDSPDGTTRLQLAWGQAAGAAAVREAYEPEIEEEPAAATESSLEW